MPPESSFSYDDAQRRVLFEVDGDPVEVYTDVSPAEFELVSAVDEFVSRATRLHEGPIHCTHRHQELVAAGRYFDQLDELQRRAGRYFHEGNQLQERVADSSSDVVTAQLGMLYKVEKFLKHYFRALTIGQNIGFSQRWLTQYVVTNDHLYLYAFVRNVCSTVEYGGVLIENWMGDGRLDRSDTGRNCVTVYEVLKEQGLDEVLNADEEIRLPPHGQMERCGDLRLSTAAIEYVWEKRCDIVHHCPLVVDEDDTTHLPEELVSTSILTGENIDHLTHLGSRLHFHSVCLFFNYMSSYMKNVVGEMVEAVYQQR